jgi:hypothetical protein
LSTDNLGQFFFYIYLFSYDDVYPHKSAPKKEKNKRVYPIAVKLSVYCLLDHGCSDLKQVKEFGGEPNT